MHFCKKSIMAKTKNKTTETEQSVAGFINAVPEENQRLDAIKLANIMQAQTGFGPKLWGPSIVGFGSYHYKYESGREGDAPLVAFSPRKDAISLYTLLPEEKRESLLQRLGKHKAGKGCIYIKRMSDVDEKVVEEMIDVSVAYLKELYG
jgi:hypothetical protein